MLKFIILLTVIGCALGAAVLPPQGLQTELDGRIVEGRPTAIRSFPYQISLQSRGRHNCGGTIISEQIIVTAAHCLQGANVENLKVRAGSSQWTSGGTLVGVKSFKTHKNYNGILNNNDVAVLRLNSSLVFSSTIRPAKLATVEFKSGAEGIVSGWGRTKFGTNSLPTQLRYVEMKLLTSTECKEYKYPDWRIRKDMICTYSVGKDSCQGDSGGPLVSNNTLVGVVSWGNGCAFENFPGVYANVVYFRDWIISSAAELEKSP